MRRAQPPIPSGGASLLRPAASIAPSLTESTAADVTRHRTSAEFRAKLLRNLQKSSETVSRDVDYVVLGSSTASSSTQSTPDVVGLQCQLPCALQAAGYPCLSNQCDDNTHVQFQRAMESSATERAMQGAFIMSEANDPWTVAQVLPSASSQASQASHAYGSAAAMSIAGGHPFVGEDPVGVQPTFGGRLLPAVENLTLSELIEATLNEPGPLPLLTDVDLDEMINNF